MPDAASLLALTFLAPTAGLVAAALSVPLLALLYFLKLRRRPMRVSSTLLWDASASDLQVNVPFRWIRPSWLLVLQAILLALLALAIARPAIEGNQAPTGRIAIVIDHSASMGATDVTDEGSTTPRSRLEEARSQALQFIDRLDSSAQAMVVALAARPQALTNLTRDRGQLRRAVASIEQTDQPGDLPAALDLVGAALRSADEESSPGRVVLLSDGEGDMTRHVGPSGLGAARLEFIRVGPPAESDKDNVGIVALAAKRDYDDPTSVRLFVRVQSAIPRPVDTTLTVLIDGAAERTERVTIPAAVSADEPGELARSFEFVRPEGGLVLVRLGRPDALAADDVAALVLEPPVAPRILLVQPDESSSIVDGLALDALASTGPGALRSMSQSEFEPALAQGVLSSAFDLAVLDRVSPPSLPALPTLSFGAGLAIPGLRVEAFEEGDPRGGRTEIAYWRRTHPIMRSAPLANVNVDRPLRMELPGQASDDSSATAIELASGASGPLIAAIEHRGVRRLVVAFALSDSRWWQQPSFPIFIKNSVDHLVGRGSDQAGRAWTTDENVIVRVEPSAQTLEVRGPITLSRTVEDPTDGTPRERQSIGTLHLVGTYSIDGAAPIDQTVTVNLLDPDESSIRTRDELRVGSERFGATTIGAMAPREIWAWFVMAILVLLAIEWCVFAWRMRL